MQVLVSKGDLKEHPKGEESRESEGLVSRILQPGRGC